MRRVTRWRQVLVGLAFAFALVPASAPTARAGTYTISGTCGVWDPENYTPGRVVPSSACPNLFLNLVPGAPSPVSAETRWAFNAPPGTGVSSFNVQALLFGREGWQAVLIATSVGILEGCPSVTCPGGYKF